MSTPPVSLSFRDAEDRLSGLYTTEHLARWWMETVDEIDDEIDLAFLRTLAADGDEIAQVLTVTA